MVADKKEHDPVAEFKENPIFKTGTDFPVVSMPIFKSQPGGQCRLSIQIFQKSFNGLISFFFARARESFKATVKAGFKFELHVISSSASDA